MPLIFCIPKKNKYVQVIAQKVIGIVKKKNSINDSKRRKSRMALSCRKKAVYIIKRNNIKRKLKFKDYKKCLKASQIENKIKYLEKKTDTICVKQNQKEFLKLNKYQKQSKDLKVKCIMFLLMKLIRLL